MPAPRQADQMLRSAKPGEIPFYRATKFEVVIKTARALALTIPPTLLVCVDEVVE